MQNVCYSWSKECKQFPVGFYETCFGAETLFPGKSITMEYDNDDDGITVESYGTVLPFSYRHLPRFFGACSPVSVP